MIPKARVKKLEDAARSQDYTDDTILVLWDDDPNQIVKVRGEDMTLAEFERRNPKHKVIVWDIDVPDIA